ncbi:hypothetical protein VNO78_05653 [Psophocarpus tetragonolobus]|uniref:Uncharacterized protein n=1 Tax=Psophocarpus tetragonolobus TaxID=3891 RepID=A0AAN9T127_PSOTE
MNCVTSDFDFFLLGPFKEIVDMPDDKVEDEAVGGVLLKVSYASDYCVGWHGSSRSHLCLRHVFIGQLSLLMDLYLGDLSMTRMKLE